SETASYVRRLADSSVQIFAVLLSSVRGSLRTTLQPSFAEASAGDFANAHRCSAHRGLAPFG
ncbi:MAG: hypothetical protein ABIR06_20765, partial [Cyclobacteriaceae bacterium]